MIIEFNPQYEGFTTDGGREADRARRAMMELYPNAIWERNEPYGHKIIVLD